MKKIRLLLFIFLLTVFFIKINEQVLAYSCKYDCAAAGCSDFGEGERCALPGDSCPGSISVNCTVDGVPNTTVSCPFSGQDGVDCCCNGQGTCCGSTNPTNTPTPTNTPSPTTTPPLQSCSRCSKVYDYMWTEWQAADCIIDPPSGTVITRTYNNTTCGVVTPIPGHPTCSRCSKTQEGKYVWWDLETGKTCQDDPSANTTIYYADNPSCHLLTGTPTPTPISACLQNKSITLSSSSTPTPSANAGLIKFKVRLQGVEYANIGKEEYKTQKAKVSIVRQVADTATGTTTTTFSKTFSDVSITAVSDPNSKIAYWQGEFTPTDVPFGTNYTILIKGSKHLQRKFCANNPTENAEGGYPYRCLGNGAITLTSETNELDFKGVLLQGGDLPTQDGIVNAYDVSRILDILINGESTNASHLTVADIDLNGIVNAKDRSYLIETLEEKYGDEE